jgi:cytochrome c1
VSISNSLTGVGPITKLELTTISDSLMQRGQQLFKDECSQCHTMEFKNSGPDISDILAVRKPEWIVNFLLNKEEMLQRDSLAIGTRLKYNEDCGANIKNKNEALEILEYLRIYQIWLHEFNVK